MSLLENRVALITGAGRGIGSAVARLFAAEGARVAAVYHESAETAQSLARDIGGVALQADLTKPDDAARVAEQAISSFGRIDILVNAAASFTHGKLFVEDDWSAYSHEVEGVLGATFHITRAVVPHMEAAGYGRIVNFGASLLWRPTPRYGPHIVAKSAVEGLTKALAQELGPKGVTVNIIHPGMTLTDFSQSLPESQRDAVVGRTPMRRLATPDDVARAALFFASDLAGFVTGAGLAPDGGLAVL